MDIEEYSAKECALIHNIMWIRKTNWRKALKLVDNPLVQYDLAQYRVFCAVKNGETPAEVARQFGISAGLVRYIVERANKLGWQCGRKPKRTR
jgi:hypothetical protein